MRRHVWLTTIGELVAVAILMAAPFVVRADVGSFSDDFSSTNNREERTSFANWDTVKKQLTLPQTSAGYASSAAAESRTIANSYSQVFKKATLSVEGDFPANTRVDYFLTSSGSYWESVLPGQEYTFKSPGNDLRYKVVLSSSSSMQTPTLKKIKIDYVRENAASADTYRNNDSQRLNDMRDIASALAKFKAERRSYPIVEAGTPKDRWKQMMQLLLDGRFMTRTPVDAKQAPDNDFAYDYLSGANGSAYLIRARFEDTGNTALTTDKDGVFAEITGNYTCNDPWYCDGQGITAASETVGPAARPFSPLTDAKPTGTVVSPIGAPTTAGSGNVVAPSPVAVTRTPISFELLRDAKGQTWYLANTVGGKQVKVLVPSATMLAERTNVAVNTSATLSSALEKIPRARLAKIYGRNEIFFLTGRWQKRWLPTWEVFKSYKDNNLKNVVELDDAIMGLFDDSKLVRLEGDSRIWFIEGNTKREVPNDRAMRRYKLDWNDVSGMNRTEFNYYQEGPVLE